MADQNNQPEKKTATQTLAELVAKRKAGGGNGGSNPFAPNRQFERAAAAKSASKSKPALRK